MIELKECPFCGGTPERRSTDCVPAKYWHQCRCGIEQALYPTKAEAITAWNARPSLSAQAVGDGWRCFHCEEVFTDREAAALHFGDYGPRSYTDAHCLIDATKLREMEFLLQRYQEEDGPIHRLMHRQAGEHSVALRHAEEAGYAAALKDTNWKESGTTPPQPADGGDRVGELVEALIEARQQLEAYEFGITGEHYNSPQINAALAKFQPAGGES